METGREGLATRSEPRPPDIQVPYCTCECDRSSHACVIIYLRSTHWHGPMRDDDMERPGLGRSSWRVHCIALPVSCLLLHLLARTFDLLRNTCVVWRNGNTTQGEENSTGWARSQCKLTNLPVICLKKKPRVDVRCQDKTVVIKQLERERERVCVCVCVCVCVSVSIRINVLEWIKPDPWRNGSASDSRSEGCVFDSRRVQYPDQNPDNFFLFLCKFFSLSSYLLSAWVAMMRKKTASGLILPI